LNRLGISESGRTTASNPGSTGARGDKSFGAGAGNLLKVALSVKTQSFGVALLARSPNCSHEIDFSFLNGNLMVPAGRPSIFNSDGNACGSRQHRGVTLHQSIEPSSC